MSRDYKDRGAYARRREAAKKPKKTGRWILIGILVVGFTGFLVYLRLTKPVESVAIEQPTIASSAGTTNTKQNQKKSTQPDKTASKPVPAPAPAGPKFDFYTILPQAETIVPEHEIKTRIREELSGKTRETRYILQAGSFRDFKDADKLKAELALMGIQSKIEKAKVGEVIWHRVKLGPYAQLASIETIKTRLKKNGLDVMITEIVQEKR